MLLQATGLSEMPGSAPSVMSDGNLQGMGSFNPDDLFNDEG